jgi:hypothetical protein
MNSHQFLNVIIIVIKEFCKLDRLQFIIVTYEIRVFFEGAQKEVFSSIF